MLNPLDNEQIIRLTAFIDAGGQLSRSEYFGEDNFCRISSDGSAEFGPATQLVASLVPFRRMWMEQEVANFNCVAKIIENTSLDPIRRGMAKQQRELYNAYRNLLDDRIKRTQKEIVDFWINTQHAHCQIDKKRGYVTRPEFDAIAKQVGGNYFEYAFRNAVRLLGMHMLVLYFEAVRPEFDDLINGGSITPPFTPENAFGSDYSEQSVGGERISRTSHVLLETEWPPLKLVRILQRNEYQNLRFILRHLLDLDDSNESAQSYAKAYDLVSKYKHFDSLCAAVGYTEKEVDLNMQYSTCNFTDTVTLQKGTVRIHSIDRIISFGDCAKELLALRYCDLRTALFTEPRQSTFSQLQQRLQRDLDRQREFQTRRRLSPLGAQ